MGEGDLHDTVWDDMQVTVNLQTFSNEEMNTFEGNCVYTLQVYPSDELKNSDWDSTLPVFFACVVATTFVVMAITFGMYDFFVRRRNAKVESAAARSNKIVSSLFPSNVRDRLLAEEEKNEKRAIERGTRTRLKDFLANDSPSTEDLEESDDNMFKTQPIADLFPKLRFCLQTFPVGVPQQRCWTAATASTAVVQASNNQPFSLFCLAGFTAWSSAREPSQVFTLLETVYRAFDE